MVLLTGLVGPLAAAAVVAVGERAPLQEQQPDWKMEHWGGWGPAGVQRQGSFLQWPTGFGGGLTGQPA